VSVTTPTRVRREPADRRRELLDAADALARADGLAALGPAAVGSRAGASKALVFHYFGSNAGLRRAVAERAVAALEQAIAPVGGTVEEQRRRIVAAYVDAVTERHRVWRDIWEGALAGDAPTEAALARVRTALVERLVQSGGAAGSTPTARLVAAGWVALVETMTARWLADGGAGVSRDELERLVLDSLAALPR